MLSDAQSWLVTVSCLAGPAEPTSALAAALDLPHRAHALSAIVSPCTACGSHSAFVFLTGSCDRRQIMSTKALETKKTGLQLSCQGHVWPQKCLRTVQLCACHVTVLTFLLMAIPVWQTGICLHAFARLQQPLRWSASSCRRPLEECSLHFPEGGG